MFRYVTREPFEATISATELAEIVQKYVESKYGTPTVVQRLGFHGRVLQGSLLFVDRCEVNAARLIEHPV